MTRRRPMKSKSQPKRTRKPKPKPNGKKHPVGHSIDVSDDDAATIHAAKEDVDKAYQSIGLQRITFTNAETRLRAQLDDAQKNNTNVLLTIMKKHGV